MLGQGWASVVTFPQATEPKSLAKGLASLEKFAIFSFAAQRRGGLAQLVERLLCKQDVSGSSPLTSTFETS